MTARSTLTVDTRLRNDLTCTGDGLIIGADGITVDLSGHTLRGSGTGAGITMAGRRAVKVSNRSIGNLFVGNRVGRWSRRTCSTSWPARSSAATSICTTRQRAYRSR
ncbi:hypothetical protein [Dactylosporangium sp. NPDC005555]|uniref:hypothetical protein n=1 Tax=Dactylosporangium sp. NPDC005555 TaxID=3154889 RepID=UPI0033ADD875